MSSNKDNDKAAQCMKLARRLAAMRPITRSQLSQLGEFMERFLEPGELPDEAAIGPDGEVKGTYLYSLGGNAADREICILRGSDSGLPQCLSYYKVGVSKLPWTKELLGSGDLYRFPEWAARVRWEELSKMLLCHAFGMGDADGLDGFKQDIETDIRSRIPDCQMAGIDRGQLWDRLEFCWYGTFSILMKGLMMNLLADGDKDDDEEERD